MNNTNTITFKYTYPKNANDTAKEEIDIIITNAITRTFWELYRKGHITNFYLIDEDMAQPTGEQNDEDEL